MAHFAKVVDSFVTEIVVAEEAFIMSGALGDPSEWVQTSYNTRGGIYYKPDTDEPAEDQSKALRKNHPGIGYTYDVHRDAFIPERPFMSWQLNEFSCLWEPPVPYPDDGDSYYWDEATTSWVAMPYNEEGA